MSPARLLVLIVLVLALAAGVAWALDAGRDDARATEGASNGRLHGPRAFVASELPEPSDDAAAAGLPRRAGPERAGEAVAPSPDAVPAMGGPGAAAAPLVTGASFDGLSDDDNAPDVVSPPDPQIAVGPGHVFEMVNTTGRIYDRSGATIDTVSLADFFDVAPAPSHGDPKVLYDALSGRWFATYLSSDDNASGNDEGFLHLAISASNDPTGEWSAYVVSYGNNFPDQPGLGVSSDKVTISSNVFDIDGPPGPVSPGCDEEAGYCGVETIVIQKSDLLAGIPAEDIDSYFFPLDPLRFGVRPAHSLSATNDQWLATWDLLTLDQLTVIKVTGSPDAGNVAETATNVTTATQLGPPPSRTAGAGDCIIGSGDNPENLGPPPCVDSGDERVLDVTWRDGRLWASASALCRPAGDAEDRSCAHLIEVETEGTPSVEQEIMFGGPAGHSWSWPAVRTDAANNLYVSLTHTSMSIFAEAALAGRAAADPAGAIGGAKTLRMGDVVHTSGRWGDYLGAAADPTDPACVWVVGQYAKETSGADWGTHIAAASYGGGCGGGAPPPTPTGAPPGPIATLTPAATLDLATPTQTPGGPPAATPTRTATRTPTVPSGVVGDANCDGETTAVDAALVLQLNAGLVDDVPCPENADVNGDGLITAVDAALILQFVAGILDEL
jgi:hypothetical protein